MSRAALCAAALLMLPVAALPQPPARDNAAPASGTARIRGRVVESPSNRPLSRVEIRAGSGTGAQASALTDAEGRYELTDLPAGTYTVSATKANYVARRGASSGPKGRANASRSRTASGSTTSTSACAAAASSPERSSTSLAIRSPTCQ